MNASRQLGLTCRLFVLSSRRVRQLHVESSFSLGSSEASYIYPLWHVLFAERQAVVYFDGDPKSETNAYDGKFTTHTLFLLPMPKSVLVGLGICIV